MDQSTNKFINLWLSIILLMVLAMVLIGGVTRLTDSGLSMVEWKPLLGIVPPINETEWLVVFEKYKQFPEYQIVNQRMNLSEFKFIYFWEYFHRLFGRLIGLVFFFPLAFLLLKKRVNKLWAKRLILAFILGGSQGLLGWFMVKSGLVDKPDVSHLRLAAHFSLALIIMGYIYWLLLKLKDNSEKAFKFSENYLLYFSLFLIVQIIYGAFVAGLDAGMVFNTYPLMGNSFIPSLLFSDGINMFINGNAGVQFVHRLIGLILLLNAIYIFFKGYTEASKQKKNALYMLVAMTFVQFVLGVSTLVLKVPLALASMHQIGACILVLLTLRAIYIFAPNGAQKDEELVFEEKVILT
jgi:cytochrome c oxidase assembly protein subunit 15